MRITKGLYLAYWPNGSFSVVCFTSRATIADLFAELDAFGDPFDARVVRFCGDVAIDFEAAQRRGRRVVRKSLSDRGRVKRVVFPRNILAMVYGLKQEACDGR
jgi:hypothetical protein